jgi:stage V sporulation protein K
VAIESGQLSPLEALKKLREMDQSVNCSQDFASRQVEERIENILRELDNLVGLAEVKKLVREIYAFIEIRKRRERERLNTEPLVLHMIFRGNPGTGKTTVARILGRVFREMGVLSRGHLIEVDGPI